MCRATILRTLGTNGDVETVEEAKRRFEAHLAGTSVIPADLRAAVSSVFLINSTKKKLIKLKFFSRYMLQY